MRRKLVVLSLFLVATVSAAGAKPRTRTPYYSDEEHLFKLPLLRRHPLL